MGLFKKNRVNIVITNRALRYTYYKNAKNTSLTFGEEELPIGVMKDGRVESRVALVKIVKKLVKSHKWSGSNIYFCVPDDTVVIRQLQIPVTLTMNEAVSYVKTQLGTSIYLPFEDPSIAIEFLEEEDKKRNLLLFAYPEEKIIEFEGVFKEAGLKSKAVDLTSPSVYRYYYKKRQEKADGVLHIHWNLDALSLTTYRLDKAIFTRYMSNELYEEKQELKEDEASQVIDDYIREITRIIDFYQYSITKGEERINLLLVTGDFPYLHSVFKILEETVNIPIYKFEEEIPIKFIDALGLALKNGVHKGETI